MIVLIQDFGKNFTHMITIDDYTGFFMAVILGLGITFEMPIVIFFLSLFGIVDAKFLLKHFRYAIIGIFLIAAIICPSPEPQRCACSPRRCWRSISSAWPSRILFIRTAASERQR